jgi:hypothetical protein
MVLALLVGALGVLFLLPALPAAAVDINPFDDCQDEPAPARPDSGIAGWFLSAPKNPPTGDPFAKDSNVSIYDKYGYAGLSYNTYDLGCGGAARDPGATSMTEMANIVATPAMWLVALDNSVREYAYRPDSMWGWTNDFVKRASDALRDRVFTIWGAVALAVVGIWLLWGARGGNLSDAAVTAGWAIMVMGLVTAVASWPIQASTVADHTLTGALGQVSSALSTQDADDKREPAVRASGVLTETILYNQWLRGTLGSADSDTAKKYGPKLYQAKALSWAEAAEMRKSEKDRNRIIDRKAAEWKAAAAGVQKDDPDAYQYLTGKKGSERVGSSMLALISALVVTPFDIMASLLILVAFLIIRLAVAFLPAIGTIGILRPAAAPLRGLLRTVLAALINCVIFGAGSAVFLLAVEVITGTNSLAGWQQVLLLWLTGLILWLLLRPYRRLTQLTGMDPFGELAGGLGKMHKKVFGDMKQLAMAGAGSYLGDVAALEANDRKRADAADRSTRPENWSRKQLARLNGPLGSADRARSQPQQDAAGNLIRGDRRAFLAKAEQADAADRTPNTGGRAGPREVSVPQAGPAAMSPVAERERFDNDYPQPTGRPHVPEDAGMVPDGEARVIYRPDRGFTRVSGENAGVGSRITQASANVASAAHAVREAVATAGAVARDYQPRKDG